MPSNIQSFELGLRKRADDTDQLFYLRMTLIAIEAAKRLVEKTPKDTGRAKGNWQMTLKVPAEGHIPRLDTTPTGSAAGSPAVTDTARLMQAWQEGQMIWYHNGLPYIDELNNGVEPHIRTSKSGNLFQHAGQPAHHMLERTTDELRRWLQEDLA